MPKFTTASTPNDYSPTAEDLRADIDALDARLDHAERRIAEALAPEPMDWHQHYSDILASVAATAARLEKGGG